MNYKAIDLLKMFSTIDSFRDHVRKVFDALKKHDITLESILEWLNEKDEDGDFLYQNVWPCMISKYHDGYAFLNDYWENKNNEHYINLNRGPRRRATSFIMIRLYVGVLPEMPEEDQGEGWWFGLDEFLACLREDYTLTVDIFKMILNEGSTQ